jgi:hypothetical protein
MVTTARRRDPRDGRTLRIVDESFWSRERDMLSLRLSLLHDFLSSKGNVNHEVGAFIHSFISIHHYSHPSTSAPLSFTSGPVTCTLIAPLLHLLSLRDKNKYI